MRASHVDYLAPARFDDLIEAFVRVSRIGRTSITYECAAYRLPHETLMVQATQTLVLVDSGHRPTPIPESFRETIGAFEGADLEA
jgi:acyl-CoA thioester hydrolase